MASQTSYYAKIGRPELGGQKLTVQYGHAKFLAKRKTCTMTVGLRTVRSVALTWRSGANTDVSASGMLRTTGSVGASRWIKVTRATLGGCASGASFWYELMGW